jgi:hypothetical protein
MQELLEIFWVDESIIGKIRCSECRLLVHRGWPKWLKIELYAMTFRSLFDKSKSLHGDQKTNYV